MPGERTTPDIGKQSSESHGGKLGLRIERLMREGRLRRETVSIGGKTAEQLRNEIAREKVGPEAEDLLESKDFQTSKTAQDIELVYVTPGDLGFSGSTDKEELYREAKQNGLDVVPAEVGPHLRLKLKDLLSGDFTIGMEPIVDSEGEARVFRLDSAEPTEKDRRPSLSAVNGEGAFGEDEVVAFRLPNKS